MKKNFAQFKHMELPDEAGNALVAAGIKLTEMYAGNKENKNLTFAEREDYEQANKTFTESFIKYCVESSGVAKYTGLDILKNPMVSRDEGFRRKFNAVIAQVMTPVAPAVVSQEFMDISEVKQIGWGETGRFIVKSNDLFLVNDIAEGVQTGGLQRLYNNEFTVNPTPKQIRFDIPWYEVAAGNLDFGEWSFKVGASFGGYINANIIYTFTTQITTYVSAASPYVAVGFSDANFITIAQRVSTANANAEVYCMGSLLTVGKVLPSTTGLQYGLGEQWTKQGYLDKYKGVRILPMSPAQVPGTVNTSALMIVPDGQLYFIGMGTYKPIKVVFEGENVVVESIPTETPDKTGGMAVTFRMGISSIVGSRFGAITSVS
jgi:hypothetical protein